MKKKTKEKIVSIKEEVPLSWLEAPVVQIEPTREFPEYQLTAIGRNVARAVTQTVIKEKKTKPFLVKKKKRA